jgi:peptidoglycan/LPS O-acetylase OafA/YrhL
MLRALAIFLVIAAHVLLLTGILLPSTFIARILRTDIGNGVSLFLVLSGIALELKYGKKTVKYKYFIFKRLRHIYPIYWICLFFGVLIAAFYGYVITGNFFSQLQTIHISEWLCSILGMCSYFGYWGGVLLPTSWFIGLIIPLYFLYPFLSKWMRHKPHVMIGLTFVMSFSTYLLLREFKTVLGGEWFYRAFPLIRLFEFSFGIYLVNVLPASIWMLCNNSPQLLKKIFVQISYQSFPLFLIHFPLLFMFSLLQNKFPTLVNIAIYVFVSVLMAKLIIFVWKSLKTRIIQEEV